MPTDPALRPHLMDKETEAPESEVTLAMHGGVERIGSRQFFQRLQATRVPPWSECWGTTVGRSLNCTVLLACPHPRKHKPIRPEGGGNFTLRAPPPRDKAGMSNICSWGGAQQRGKAPPLPTTERAPGANRPFSRPSFYCHLSPQQHPGPPASPKTPQACIAPCWSFV